MDEMNDMFGDVAQPEREAPARQLPLTDADVRAQMVEIIATLREADDLPYEPAVWRKHVAMFPIMAQWLESEDGNQLIFQFEAEIERLQIAA